MPLVIDFSDSAIFKEGWEEGWKEGCTKTQNALIMAMLASGDFTLRQISKIADISEQEILAIQAENDRKNS